MSVPRKWISSSGSQIQIDTALLTSSASEETLSKKDTEKDDATGDELHAQGDGIGPSIVKPI